MKAVWAKALKNAPNTNLAFALVLNGRKRVELKITASSCFKLLADGKTVGSGPQRAAHGWARVSEYSFAAHCIVVEVQNCGVQTFCWADQPPFFACELTGEDGSFYEATDFTCYRLTDRVQKVPRYSFQRGFCEVYRMSEDRSSLYRGEARFPRVDIMETALPALLSSRVGNAKLTLHEPTRTVEEGAVLVDENAPVWRYRAFTDVGKYLGGYTIGEWEESPTDEASKFVFLPNGADGGAGLKYKTYDFGRAITGFTELEVSVEKAGTVWFLFDEILWHELGKGENYVGFTRNETCNVFKWTFEKAGNYKVATLEPYTVRYAAVVCSEGVEVKIAQRDYENPHTGALKFECADHEIEKILEAARATLAQNSVDILMDCPSRERAGWLSDSWFSSTAERIFTGGNRAEEALLENYENADKRYLPEGLIPRCYPCDSYPHEIDQYIPNWTMWYIWEIAKRAELYGADDALVKGAEKNVFGILGYFLKKENELGLLENLTGWVFIEWSAANDASHIAGVNVPSNMCYAACLEKAGALYGREDWCKKAENVRAKLKELAFDGRFFVDNLIRDEKGELKRTENLTEVCQYYAFWFDCVTREEYPDLFEELIERLGRNRAEGYLPEMEKPNVMFGIYMRIDLLMRMGERKRVLEECKHYFLPMAIRTGTLWEHNGIRASCDHGFASYVVRWLVYALTGFDPLLGEKAATEGIGVDCKITLPADKCGRTTRLTVENDRVRLQRTLLKMKPKK